MAVKIDDVRVKVLGTPVGSDAFVEAFVDKRVKDEKKLWDALQFVPDLQCAWQLVLQCAGPRCHHLLRTLPPTQAQRYAQSHDDGVRGAAAKLLGGLPGN